jgi:UDP-2-acetamido-3-amino-2,3-dideoxy-glucuronate N-acetyltransferase
MAKRETKIDPTAIVDPTAEIGRGVWIWSWSKVREGARIGEDTNIGQNVYIDFDTSVGHRCKIQSGVYVYHGVTIGNDVFIGPNATFSNDRFPRAHDPYWQLVHTFVEDGASIGANATIVCGVTLGRHCMVGAGALVTRDVPPHALVVGCPAKIVDYITVKGIRVGWKQGDAVPAMDQLVDKPLG